MGVGGGVTFEAGDDVLLPCSAFPLTVRNKVYIINFVFITLSRIAVARRSATLAQRSDTVRFFRCSGAILAPGCILAIPT